ncbi:uncharacterized protein LOC130755358 [Actinidia eriantha]|uniref:uncharacterized protein LOC130755358 n=1 Tax=Actinidia eriantha TaxID=165200 RepID=UPI00258E2018|nr:uncharacterized protein LOC130755358 [Actinidia eriantha]
MYLQEYNYPGYDLKWSFTSVMYHEMTHIWQWYAPGTPSGLIEGIADYTSIKANYYPPELAKPGSGVRWDQGYGPTARFLEYCDRLRPRFVAALNRKMRYEWSVDYFVDLLGKPVDQLWSEYKAEYEGSVSNVAVNANLSLWREYKDAYYEIKTRTETGIGCQLD